MGVIPGAELFAVQNVPSLGAASSTDATVTGTPWSQLQTPWDPPVLYGLDKFREFQSSTASSSGLPGLPTTALLNEPLIEQVFVAEWLADRWAMVAEEEEDQKEEETKETKSRQWQCSNPDIADRINGNTGITGVGNVHVEVDSGGEGSPSGKMVCGQGPQGTGASQSSSTVEISSNGDFDSGDTHKGDVAQHRLTSEFIREWLARHGIPEASDDVLAAFGIAKNASKGFARKAAQGTQSTHTNESTRIPESFHSYNATSRLFHSVETHVVVQSRRAAAREATRRQSTAVEREARRGNKKTDAFQLEPYVYNPWDACSATPFYNNTLIQQVLQDHVFSPEAAGDGAEFVLGGNPQKTRESDSPDIAMQLLARQIFGQPEDRARKLVQSIARSREDNPTQLPFSPKFFSSRYFAPNSNLKKELQANYFKFGTPAAYLTNMCLFVARRLKELKKFVFPSIPGESKDERRRRETVSGYRRKLLDDSPESRHRGGGTTVLWHGHHASYNEFSAPDGHWRNPGEIDWRRLWDESYESELAGDIGHHIGEDGRLRNVKTKNGAGLNSEDVNTSNQHSSWQTSWTSEDFLPGLKSLKKIITSSKSPKNDAKKLDSGKNNYSPGNTHSHGLKQFEDMFRLLNRNFFSFGVPTADEPTRGADTTNQLLVALSPVVKHVYQFIGGLEKQFTDGQTTQTGSTFVDTSDSTTNSTNSTTSSTSSDGGTASVDSAAVEAAAESLPWATSTKTVDKYMGFGGDRMSNEMGGAAHNYGIVYAYHFLRWLRKLVGERVRENLKGKKSEASFAQNINVGEVGILAGSGLAIWSMIFPGLVDSVWDAGSKNLATKSKNNPILGPKPSVSVHGFDLRPHFYLGNRQHLWNRGAFRQAEPWISWLDQDQMTPSDQGKVIKHAAEVAGRRSGSRKKKEEFSRKNNRYIPPSEVPDLRQDFRFMPLIDGDKRRIALNSKAAYGIDMNTVDDILFAYDDEHPHVDDVKEKRSGESTEESTEKSAHDSGDNEKPKNPKRAKFSVVMDDGRHLASSILTTLRGFLENDLLDRDNFIYLIEDNCVLAGPLSERAYAKQIAKLERMRRERESDDNANGSSKKKLKNSSDSSLTPAAAAASAASSSFSNTISEGKAPSREQVYAKHTKEIEHLVQINKAHNFLHKEHPTGSRRHLLELYSLAEEYDFRIFPYMRGIGMPRMSSGQAIQEMGSCVVVLESK